MHELPYTVQDADSTMSSHSVWSSEQPQNSHSQTPPPSYTDSQDDNHARRSAMDLPSPPSLPQTPLPSYSAEYHGRAPRTPLARPNPSSQRLNTALNVATTPNSLANISPVQPRVYQRPVDPCGALVWIIIASMVLATVIGVLVWVLA
ncbi:hypothetical protein GRF29_44g2419521 [Pseudopithomyces chartarum]|uniref:Uncharacterized protein n=1 Tax=Pseudopithomyces chartarum TaxID=1892770 RepID=A0AAN6LYZ8_9PLEO|nr:hypothetical protein GRF29_44g2419521 [Pseudopithomyces chartarum]